MSINREDKGKFLGSCNRGACQVAGAVFYNTGNYQYYCIHCAKKINEYNVDLVIDITNVNHSHYEEYRGKEEFNLALNSKIANPYARNTPEYFIFKMIRFAHPIS